MLSLSEPDVRFSPRNTCGRLGALGLLVCLAGCARSGVDDDATPSLTASLPTGMDSVQTSGDAPEPGPSETSAGDAGAPPAQPIVDNGSTTTEPDGSEGPTPTGCGAVTACSLDTNLGEIQLYGDSGTQLTTSGQGHAWVTLEAQDEHDALNFGSFASYVSVEATLDAASAPDYEVFVYAHTAPGTEKNDQDPRDLDACLTANDETLAALASSCARWSGDGPVVDNLRSVVIEVRPLGDGCTDWELTVIGYNDDDRECAGLNENNGM